MNWEQLIAEVARTVAAAGEWMGDFRKAEAKVQDLTTRLFASENRARTAEAQALVYGRPVDGAPFQASDEVVRMRQQLALSEKARAALDADRVELIRITVGAASLMGALTLGTALVRWAVSPVSSGQHRAARTVTVLDDASLDELLGDWEPVYGAALAQAWHDCPACGHATAGVVQGDGWLCGECLTPVGGDRR